MKTSGSAPVLIEQVFDAPVDKVWTSITQVDQMRRWFFPNIPAFKAAAGFETSFDAESGGRTFTHQWKVTEVSPGRMIRYRWKYRQYRGEGTVTFELSESRGKTLLRLTNSGLESFPQDIPEFSRESCEIGWRYLIGERLKGVLKGSDHPG
jgi:uncharacterized protein YndB with AHSA1/START domain